MSTISELSQAKVMLIHSVLQKPSKKEFKCLQDRQECLK